MKLIPDTASSQVELPATESAKKKSGQSFPTFKDVEEKHTPVIQ